MESYTTETIDRLFLELSQFTTAKTARELALESRLHRIIEALEKIVIPQGVDAGVVLLDGNSPVNYEIYDTREYAVYQHEYFSPLGDALVSLWKITQED